MPAGREGDRVCLMKQIKWCSFFGLTAWGPSNSFCFLSFPTHILSASGGPQSSPLPPKPTVCPCLGLNFPWPFPFSLPLTETLRFPVGPISESCYWEEFQEGPIYIEMRMIAAPFHPHRSTDICSLKESFINLRQSLSGGKASHGTRSGLPS